MRLLSYNIHKGIGGRDRRYRLSRVLEVIQRVEADIICLQEVDQSVKRSSFDDQPAILSHELGMNSAYQLNHQIKSGGYGNCTLSRFPILEQQSISLRVGGRKNRGALLTVLDSHSGPISIINWHLGLSERDRHQQVAMLVQSEVFTKHSKLPTIIAGDSNDWRNTLHRGILNESGYSAIMQPPSQSRSFPAYMPIGALDKAFGNSQIQGAHGQVINTKLTRAASDHLPAQFDFIVEG